jgi:hypothetical protein
VWGILEGLTQLIILSFVSVNVPGIAYQVNTVLLNLAQLDILPSSQIKSWFFEFDDDGDEAFNS